MRNTILKKPADWQNIKPERQQPDNHIISNKVQESLAYLCIDRFRAIFFFYGLTCTNEHIIKKKTILLRLFAHGGWNYGNGKNSQAYGFHKM